MRYIALLLVPAWACSNEPAPSEPHGHDEPVAHTSPLTAEQCTFFEVDDKVTLCHRTGSAKNPYVVIRTNSMGCVSGHAGHAGDYIATSDPTCRSLGCYPEGAPADSLVPCCGGAPVNGHCPPIDACKETPCAAGETCVDLPHPAAGDATGRECLSSICGNALKESGEACDGKDVGGVSCESLGLGTGFVGCTEDCSEIVTKCVPCDHDGELDIGEQCDGEAFPPESSCQSFGWASGELGCKDCRITTESCTNCGNGVVDEGEACDGEALNGATCESLGLGTGLVACADDCSQVFTKRCIPCDHDGEIDPGERCDGDDLGDATCESLGFSGGTLACGDACSFDTSGCTTSCGDGELQDDEECDWGALLNGTQPCGCDASCRWVAKGTPCEDGLACTAGDYCLGDGSCGPGDSTCAKGEICAESGCMAAPPVCGDGRREGDEECDNGNANGASGCCSKTCTVKTTCDDGNACTTSDNCMTVVPGHPVCIGSGDLCAGTGAACDPIGGTCSRCGDGVVQPEDGEACDFGANNGASPCSCTSECQLSTVCPAGKHCRVGDPALEGLSYTCESTCGNGVVDPGEACDGDNTGIQCSSGTQTCWANCGGLGWPSTCSQVPATCGDGFRNWNEQCDGADLGNVDCNYLGIPGPGTLSCNTDCTFNVVGCGREPVCGNGLLEPGEACDDPSNACCIGCGMSTGASCEDGDVCTVGDACVEGVCGAGSAYACPVGSVCADASGSPVCRSLCENGKLETELGEICDPTVPTSAIDCVELGYAGSSVSLGASDCTQDCEWDATRCLPPPCEMNALRNQDGGDVEILVDGRSLSARVPPGGFVDADGAPIVSDGCDIVMTLGSVAFDGAFITDDGAEIDAMILADIEFTRHGLPVAVAPGKSVILGLPVPESQGYLTLGDEVEFFSYDEALEVWTPETIGTIDLGSDALLAAVASVTHFTWYLASTGATTANPSARGCVRVRAKNLQGQPLQGLWLQTTSGSPAKVFRPELSQLAGGVTIKTPLLTGVCGTIPLETQLNLANAISVVPGYSNGAPLPAPLMHTSTSVFPPCSASAPWETIWVDAPPTANGCESGKPSCTTTCTCAAGTAPDGAGGCVPVDPCGNGAIDSGEACDGPLSGAAADCATLGAYTGTLTCTETCQIDSSACVPVSAVCGDSIRQAGEECDGSDFEIGSDQCTALGDLSFARGSLICLSDCRVDLADCERSDTIIDAGPWHTCLVRSDLEIECWGDDSGGVVSEVPAGPFRSVAASRIRLWRDGAANDSSDAYACGLRVDGSVVCWGAPGNLPGPAPDLPAGIEFTHIATADATVCGLRSDNEITCWGHDTSITAGVPLGVFIDVAVGEAFACALRSDGSTTCWGARPGVWSGCKPVDEHTPAECPPLDLPRPSPAWYTQLSAGPRAYCARDSADDVACRGEGGDPTIWNNDGVHPPADFVDVGNPGACLIDVAGLPHCWANGDNLGDTSIPGLPTDVVLRALTRGSFTACGVTALGQVACWCHPIEVEQDGTEHLAPQCVPPSVP